MGASVAIAGRLTCRSGGRPPPTCRGPARRTARRRRPGGPVGRAASVLVGLLWCVALLSVVVVGVLHAARLDLRVGKNHGDLIQAHYLALAGIEKAKALLYHEAAERRRSARHHSGALYDAPEHFRDVPLGRGRFRVFYQAPAAEGGGLRFGVSDEESRLNLNHASTNELARLPGLRPDIAAAIVDYRDDDNAVTTGGAEADYYAALRPPRLPRNAPFLSVRELLAVRGVTRERLCGEDANLNGLLDADEDDGNESGPPDNSDGRLDDGWAGRLTVHSSVRNVNAAGEDRVNIQTADEATLAAVPGISAELARAIVAYRGQHRLENLADLLEVTAVSSQNQPTTTSAATPVVPGPAGGTPPPALPSPPPTPPSSTGPRLVSEELFLEIADSLTVTDEAEQPGAINLNTAGADVLACLPGVEPQLAQAIVAHRQSAGFFTSVGELLRVPGMTRELFKQIAPRVSVRSETFRILSEGRVTSTGVRKRLQAIVRVRPDGVQTLAYREDHL